MTQERRIEILMPEEIRNLKFKTLCLNRTDRVGHYQSGDAIIEEVNKEAKRDLVGVPSSSQWVRSFRNLDNMNKIRAAVFEDAHITDPKNAKSKRKNEMRNEVFKIRTLIRASGYLENPLEQCKHTDITLTIVLSEKLVNFTELAEKNRDSYIKSILLGQNYKNNVIFTTKEEQSESEKVENMPIKDINNLILAILENRTDRELLFDIYKKEVKGKVKEKYITFYYSLLETDVGPENQNDIEEFAEIL